MENTQLKIANLPAFVMAVVKELLPVGTVLARKGLTKFLLTFPKPQGVIRSEKARVITLEFDEDLAKKLHEAFLGSQEDVLAECGQLIFHHVRLHLQKKFIPSVNPQNEILNLSFHQDVLNYKRA